MNIILLLLFKIVIEMFKLVKKIKIVVKHKSHKYGLGKYLIVGFPNYYFFNAGTWAYEKKSRVIHKQWDKF